MRVPLLQGVAVMDLTWLWLAALPGVLCLTWDLWRWARR